MIKTAFQLPWGAQILKKNCFWKMLIFFQLRTWSKSFSKVLRQLFDGLEKITIQPSTETFWRRKVLVLTETIFFRLRTLTEAFPNIQTKLFYQFCQYGIQRIQRNDWMKFLSYQKLELFYHFWTWNERSTEFLPENFVTFVEIVLACPGYVFRLIFFWKICKSFMSFLYLDWFSFICGWNFLGRVCKTALYVPEDIFEEKLLVWEFVFQFFNRFRIWTKNFRTYGDNCSAAMSKLHFFRQRNKLRELLFWKIV